MIINMTTIAVRQKNDIDRTLESLLTSDGGHLPVNLIIGSSDTSHVEKYRGRCNIVVWDAAAEAQAREGRMRHNCNVNAIRSLRHGDDDYCLCCEDDITFVGDWYHQLMLTIAEIPDTDYVLNLGQGCDQSPDKRYATHTPKSLIGAQGISYPSKSLRDAVATYLEENLNRGMNDALVGTYAKRFAALYNTTPMLVGHIGGVSSFTQPKPPGEPQAKAQPKAPPAPSAAPVRRTRPVPKPRPDPREVHRVTCEVFVALVRTSLGSGARPEAARLAACDWRTFALLASHHGLVPAVYQALRDHADGVSSWRSCPLVVHATLELSRRALGIGPPAEVLNALDRGRPEFVERIAHQVLFSADRANKLRGAVSPGARRSRWLATCAPSVPRFSRACVAAFPSQEYLRAKYPPTSAPLALRARHLRALLPSLWAEARYRLDALMASRNTPPAGAR